jgi:hypothetical protein
MVVIYKINNFFGRIPNVDTSIEHCDYQSVLYLFSRRSTQITTDIFL